MQPYMKNSKADRELKKLHNFYFYNFLIKEMIS